MKLILLCVTLFVGLIALSVHGLDNGLARTPQMGFNSWNAFHCNINETLFKSTADALVATGLAAVGYKYVNMDDCWQVSRDANNRIVADASAFPSGIPSLAAYVHSKGLKFGLYSDAGNKTCAGRPGSLGYEVIDAQTYASWGVDYLKYDNCNAETAPEIRYPPMRDALNATGRPILFSMCEWGVDNPATWAAPVGNSWRTTGDISDSWDSMISIADKNAALWKSAGPGGWNDPDMLEVGNGGMTTDEYKTHFTLWCIMKAPLIIGCDVRNMTRDTLLILTNTELIEWNQDPLGIQGHKVGIPETTEVYTGPLANNRVAVVLVNRGTTNATVTAHWSELGLKAGSQYTARDVWQHKNIGLYKGSFAAEVVPHGVVAVTLVPA